MPLATPASSSSSVGWYSPAHEGFLTVALLPLPEEFAEPTCSSVGLDDRCCRLTGQHSSFDALYLA